MIIDCYTYTWEQSNELGRCLPANGKSGQETWDSTRCGAAHHLAASEPVDVSIVLGFKSRYLEAEIPNRRLAEHVRNHAERLIGFAGIDPSQPREALDDMLEARNDLGLRGLAVAPAAQDFHPTNSQAMRVYAEAARWNLPIIFHTGVFLAPAAKLEYAQPVLLDEVARELPDLKIVIAHLGYPWVHETLALLAKHRNVFAEISGITRHPWMAYQALLGASQSGVMDKLLLGSGFPLATPTQAIEELYDINHICQGTGLPPVPREQLRGIVERDALALLGITPPPQLATAVAAEVEEEVE